jgi:hypothetical protein
LQFRYGTGTAPTAGATGTGTSVGSDVYLLNIAATQYLAFPMHAVIVGLTPGTAYWFDIDGLVNTGNFTYQTGSVSCDGFEF